jgi:hypothetical protein
VEVSIPFIWSCSEGPVLRGVAIPLETFDGKKKEQIIHAHHKSSWKYNISPQQVKLEIYSFTVARSQLKLLINGTKGWKVNKKSIIEMNIEINSP